MKIRNINGVQNQFEINTGNALYMQSYESVVAKIENGKLTLGNDWDYSQTTMKHLNQWIRDNAADIRNYGRAARSNTAYIRRALKLGEIEIKDLEREY
jgi:hypothetical protein